MTVLVLMLLGLLPAKSSPVDVEQRLGRAVCRLSIDRGEVELSGELHVVISIQGPAPIEVDLPRPLTATTDWQVSASPPQTVSLGEGAEILADRFAISREEQDAFALRSHQRAHAAWEEGRIAGETTQVPDTTLERDEGIRPDTSLEKLAEVLG